MSFKYTIVDCTYSLSRITEVVRFNNINIILILFLYLYLIIYLTTIFCLLIELKTQTLLLQVLLIYSVSLEEDGFL